MSSQTMDSTHVPPLVSILIPVYNREKFIAECLQSALEQTYQHIEIIVVDNASTDSTWQICQEFAIRDPHIRIFQNETNIGPVRNWIRCAQEARGEFSKLLFSDDLLEPDCIRCMIKRIHTDVAFVVCTARVGESRSTAQIYYAQNEPLLTWREYLPRQLDWRLPVSPGAVLLRTEDLLKNLRSAIPTRIPRSFDRNGAGPDAMIMLLTAHSYKYVACVSEPQVFFRSHPGSFTTSIARSTLRDFYTSAFSYFVKQNGPWIQWLQYVSLSWLAQVLQNRSWKSFRRHLRDHEGAGSITEMLTAALLAPLWVAGSAWARYRR